MSFGPDIRNGVPVGVGTIPSLSGGRLPRPTLYIDFANGVNTLDSRITYTGQNGSYFNSSGVMTAATTNVARFDYNPTTLLPRGILIEESRTNLLLNSLVNGTSLSTQSVTVTNVAHTLSFYGTGTVTLSGTSTAGPLVGTGATTKVSLTFTPTAGSLTLTVSGTVKWANLEVGSFPTSFIPTAGASVTRANDVAVMTSTNFSSWYNATEGTFFAQATRMSNGTDGRTYEVNDNTGDNLIHGRIGSGGVLRQAVITATVAQVGQNTANATTAGTQFKQINAFKASNFGACLDGGTAVQTLSGTVPAVTQMNIGSGVAFTQPFNGWIAKLAFYNTRLPNATLVSLTT